MRRQSLILAVAVLVPIALEAQPIPQGELANRLINLPTHLTVGAATLQAVFTHRFSQTTDDAGGYDLLGLDSAADIGIGVGLGLGKHLEVELYRSSFLKELEGSVKWTLVRQGSAFPVGVATRMGIDYRGAKGIDERWSAFAQFVVARRVGDRLDLFLVPMFASDTPTMENAANVGVGMAYHMSRGWDFAAEVIAENRDARGGEMAWSVAANKRVPGHEFTIYLGNSPATTTDLLVGSDYPGSFGRGDVRLGFNLLRRFPE